MKPLSECRLYAFVDTAYLRGRAPAEIARQLCDGGADLIQLRAKQSSRETIQAMAEQLLAITKQANVALVINDHLAIAQKAGADLCHLGQEDFFDHGCTHTSQLATGGSHVGIGLSTHAPEQAERAVNAAADYVAIGPIFATATKPGVQPVTLEYVKWAARSLKIPWFAIGGITLENLDSVLAAGATRICVVSAILNSPDIRTACRRFRERLRT